MKNQEYQLLIDLKKSNKLALKKLFFNYHDTLFRFIYYRISEYDLAEDIVQETFIRVWKNRNLIDPEKSFFSYIAKISTNLCLDHFRHQKVRKRLPKGAEIQSKPFQNRTLALKLEHTILLLFAILQPHWPLQGGTETASKRIPKKHQSLVT